MREIWNVRKLDTIGQEDWSSTFNRFFIYVALLGHAQSGSMNLAPQFCNDSRIKVSKLAPGFPTDDACLILGHTSGLRNSSLNNGDARKKLRPWNQSFQLEWLQVLLLPRVHVELECRLSNELLTVRLLAGQLQCYFNGRALLNFSFKTNNFCWSLAASKRIFQLLYFAYRFLFRQTVWK